MFSRTELEILSELRKIGKPCTATTLADFVAKSRSRTSSILKVLSEKELLKSHRKGNKVYYEIDELKYLELVKIGKLKFKGRPWINPIPRKLLFGFDKNIRTLHRSNKSLKALDKISTLDFEEKTKAVQNYLEANTHLFVQDIWAIKDSFYSNYDFDLLPLRHEPMIFEAMGEIICDKFKNKLEQINGVIALYKKTNGNNSATYNAFSKNSIPFAVSVSLIKEIPLLVFENKKIFGEIKSGGNYIIIDDAPLTTKEIEDVIKIVESKNGNVKFVLLLIERFDLLTDDLSRSGININALFNSKELAKNVFLHEQQVLR